MTKDSLQEVYVDELKDLYSAENQLTKALPKMAKAASSDELRPGVRRTHRTNQRPCRTVAANI